MTYEEFFRLATDSTPFPYQARLAEGGRLPDLIDAPTGAGKTAAIILAWLWRRSRLGPEGADPMPRRLAYCLPMRVLVEQTQKAVKGWIKKLDKSGIKLCEEDIHVLMGGEDAADWDINPEKEAILIGTQDMLLSRALNRGYGMSRFRWPMPYALLNNDCLWVFDEVQLMGAGVATSAQLAGLRPVLGTFGPCRSVWMSATMEKTWLSTVDHRGELDLFALGDDELKTGVIGDRMTAKKTLRRAGLTAGPIDKNYYGKELAKAVEKATVAGTLTLVVLNTVDRAKAVYAEARKIRGPEVILLHSRFRPADREHLREEISSRTPESGRIIVSTQAIEAGVDLSASVLFTELAPWSSVVQRLGRCHRHGEPGDHYKAFWIDLPSDKASAPYEPGDLDLARTHLEELEGEDVSPFFLRTYQRARGIAHRFEHAHVIRRRDVVDLFDTSPDLSGNDIDVSRFVRGDDPETDVQIFWRDFDRKMGVKTQKAPRREELCSAPVGKPLTEFIKKLPKHGLSAYIWDHLSDAWRVVHDSEIRPGMVILLPATAGGYSWSEAEGRTGWDAGAKQVVPTIPIPQAAEGCEGTGSDPMSWRSGPPVTIAAHTQNVRRELGEILGGLGSAVHPYRERLDSAALWHDLGKAHKAYQEAVHRANRGDEALSEDFFWAKSGGRGRLSYSVDGRPRKFFRHELASALAALQHGLPFIVAYLDAAHHGRVRLSIRSLPGEVAPPGHGTELKFALGVHQGDGLPEVRLDGVTVSPAFILDLSPMELGGESSWSARALALRDKLGPFRLAYLESLLRAADMRASRMEAPDG